MSDAIPATIVTSAAHTALAAPSVASLPTLAVLPPPVGARNPVTVYLARLAPTGRRTQRSALDRVARMLVVTEPPSEPSTADTIPWQEFGYGHMVALRARLANECGAPATANRLLAAVRGVMRECANLGFITRETCLAITSVGPVKGSRLPKGRALTADEVRSLLAACYVPRGDGVSGTGGTGDGGGAMNLRDRALVAVLFGGGFRRSEVATMEYRHVQRKGARTGIVVRGKGNKDRRVPLPPDAAEALAAWMAARGAESGPLFCSFTKHHGMRRRMDTGDGEGGELRWLTASGIYDVLAAIAVRAGVPPFSPHDARRTRITNLFAANQPLVVVQRLAGHSNPATTAKYDRSSDEAMEGAANAVGTVGVMG